MARRRASAGRQERNQRLSLALWVLWLITAQVAADQACQPQHQPGKILSATATEGRPSFAQAGVLHDFVMRGDFAGFREKLRFLDLWDNHQALINALQAVDDKGLTIAHLLACAGRSDELFLVTQAVHKMTELLSSPQATLLKRSALESVSGNVPPCDSCHNPPDALVPHMRLEFQNPRQAVFLYGDVTPLECAAAQGHVQAMKQLVQRGVSAGRALVVAQYMRLDNQLFEAIDMAKAEGAYELSKDLPTRVESEGPLRTPRQRRTALKAEGPSPAKAKSKASVTTAGNGSASGGAAMQQQAAPGKCGAPQQPSPPQLKMAPVPVAVGPGGQAASIGSVASSLLTVRTKQDVDPNKPATTPTQLSEVMDVTALWLLSVMLLFPAWSTLCLIWRRMVKRRQTIQESVNRVRMAVLSVAAPFKQREGAAGLRDSAAAKPGAAPLTPRQRRPGPAAIASAADLTSSSVMRAVSAPEASFKAHIASLAAAGKAAAGPDTSSARPPAAAAAACPLQRQGSAAPGALSPAAAKAGGGSNITAARAIRASGEAPAPSPLRRASSSTAASLLAALGATSSSKAAQPAGKQAAGVDGASGSSTAAPTVGSSRFAAAAAPRGPAAKPLDTKAPAASAATKEKKKGPAAAQAASSSKPAAKEAAASGSKPGKDSTGNKPAVKADSASKAKSVAAAASSSKVECTSPPAVKPAARQPQVLHKAKQLDKEPKQAASSSSSNNKGSASKSGAAHKAAEGRDVGGPALTPRQQAAATAGRAGRAPPASPSVLAAAAGGSTKSSHGMSSSGGRAAGAAPRPMTLRGGSAGSAAGGPPAADDVSTPRRDQNRHQLSSEEQQQPARLTPAWAQRGNPWAARAAARSVTSSATPASSSSSSADSGSQGFQRGDSGSSDACSMPRASSQAAGNAVHSPALDARIAPLQLPSTLCPGDAAPGRSPSGGLGRSVSAVESHMLTNLANAVADAMAGQLKPTGSPEQAAAAPAAPASTWAEARISDPGSAAAANNTSSSASTGQAPAARTSGMLGTQLLGQPLDQVLSRPSSDRTGGATGKAPGSGRLSAREDAELTGFGGANPLSDLSSKLQQRLGLQQQQQPAPAAATTIATWAPPARTTVEAPQVFGSPSTTGMLTMQPQQLMQPQQPHVAASRGVTMVPAGQMLMVQQPQAQMQQAQSHGGMVMVAVPAAGSGGGQLVRVAMHQHTGMQAMQLVQQPQPMVLVQQQPGMQVVQQHQQAVYVQQHAMMPQQVVCMPSPQPPQQQQMLPAGQPNELVQINVQIPGGGIQTMLVPRSMLPNGGHPSHGGGMAAPPAAAPMQQAQMQQQHVSAGMSAGMMLTVAPPAASGPQQVDAAPASRGSSTGGGGGTDKAQPSAQMADDLDELLHEAHQVVGWSSLPKASTAAPSTPERA